MNNTVIRNIKLGIFVFAGLLFLILLLYMIGKNQHLWGANFRLKAHFVNVQGLSSGNNVRYSGIEAGTVEAVEILNDSTIEVRMRIKSSVRKHIRSNAIATIGTDGLVGNKIVNITPGETPASPAEDGMILQSRRSYDTDQLLQTLSSAANDVAGIAGGLKAMVTRINNSPSIWRLLEDRKMADDLQVSIANIRQTTVEAREMAAVLHELSEQVARGEGSLGSLLQDTSYAFAIKESITGVGELEKKAALVISDLDTLLTTLDRKMNGETGAVGRLLNDSMWARSVDSTLRNIQSGTSGLNELVDAAKHSFLFRRYFRKHRVK